MAMMNEWYKQLYGESEGKVNKGLFPSSAIFSTDLHSMGQYIQDGARLLFETVVDIKQPKEDLFLEPDAENAHLQSCSAVCARPGAERSSTMEYRFRK